MISHKCKITGEQVVHSKDELAIYAQFDAEPPALSKKERLRLLFSFMTGGHFFWREVAGRKVYSVYPASGPLNVVSVAEYSGSELFVEWNSRESFLPQLHVLLKDSPRPHFHGTEVNESIGVEEIFNISRSSLLLFSEDCIDCFGSHFIRDSSSIGSCVLVEQSTDCLSAYRLKNCKQIAYSSNCSDCPSSYFLSNCVSCTNCLFCVGLTGKEYFVENEFVGKEGFEKALLDLGLQSYSAIELGISRFKKVLSTAKTNTIDLNLNIFGVENLSDCADVISYSNKIANSVLSVGCGNNADSLFNCVRCTNNVSDLTYCFDCTNSRELFGCVGVSNAEYQILNKQYTKSEYQKLKAEIISSLKRKRNWGSPMGFKFSDFAYNGSLAQLIFPLTKVQVAMFEVGWDDEVESLKVDRLVSNSDLIDQIQDTPKTLIEALANQTGVFVCELSGRLFRYLPGELELAKKLNIAPSIYGHEERIRQFWQEISRAI